MLRLATHRAAPGMVLALPVMHPDIPGHVLLKPGAELDAASLLALGALNVPRIFVRYPPTAFLMRYANPEIIARHADLTHSLGSAFDAVSRNARAELDFFIFADTIRALVQRIVTDPAAAVFLAEILGGAPPLISHSANVCLLSVLMGLKLDGYLIAERGRLSPRRATNIESLGLGALLHDIGMLHLDPVAAERWERTRDESDSGYRRHTIIGFELLRGRIPATASAAVLHHHQRIDASGFPMKRRPIGAPSPLAGSEIHVFARIVAVADVFDRARAGLLPASPGAVPACRALKHTLTLVRQRRLDPMVFKALLAVTPAFAPGSLVTLSSGQACVVTSWEPTDPCAPAVSPILGSDPSYTDCQLGNAIDLRTRRDLRITICDGHDVSADLFAPDFPGEFDLRLRHTNTTLFDPGHEDYEHHIGGHNSSAA